jgi:transcriptional regulator with XRE-family HTH domain
MPSGRKTETDAFVGAKIRARRLVLNMSQTELGRRLGVTFQQVQKYEKGLNRVSAGTLYRTAQVMRAPITYFFDGLQPLNGAPDPMQRKVIDFLRTNEGARMMDALGKVPKNIRAKLVKHIVMVAAVSNH